VTSLSYGFGVRMSTFSPALVVKAKVRRRIV